MLLFTRKTGETFLIGNDIKITVVEHGNSEVQFGIEAPRDVAVYREELYKKIHQSKPEQSEDK